MLIRFDQFGVCQKYYKISMDLQCILHYSVIIIYLTKVQVQSLSYHLRNVARRPGRVKTYGGGKFHYIIMETEVSALRL